MIALLIKMKPHTLNSHTMSIQNFTPEFAAKCIVGATYRTGGGIYYRIVAVADLYVRAEEMTAQGPTGKFAKYSPALFATLFRQNCTWVTYAYSDADGRFMEKGGRSLCRTMGLERFLVRQ
jgi:hypothetical protein